MTFIRRAGVACVLVLVLAAPAAAQEPFRNVLSAGQGETVNAAELAAYQATGQPPASLTSQNPLYTGLVQAAPTLQPQDLDRYFKAEAFGVAPDQTASTTTPRPGVRIVRDRAHQVPHVFGDTRADTMFGAGYATAQDRLFFMDVLRHTGRARLTELIGPGENDETVRMDAEQLKVADYDESELQAMIDNTVKAAGTEGPVIKSDLDAYVQGVNQYIREARTDPTKLPAESPALGKLPEDWKETDTVAVASLIGGILGKGGGGEVKAEQALARAEARFGSADGRRVFDDFRTADDPEAPVTTTTRFPFDDPGAPDPAAVARPDLGSIHERDPVTDPGTKTTSAPPVRADAGWRPGELVLGGLARLPRQGLRALLGRPVASPLSRAYCGGGSLDACRAVLTDTLAAAADDVRAQYGTSLEGVRVHATGCEDEPVCDQISYVTAGAFDTPPIPWQDRPTFQQVVEIRR